MKVKAFTLIELLIVIIIIGILATIAVPQYQKMVDKAKGAEAHSNIGTLKKAQEIYYLERGYYALDLNKLDINFEGSPGKKVTKNFIYGTDPAAVHTAGYGITMSAWTNTGTIDSFVYSKPQYHMHETGDIIKTEVSTGGTTPSHDHNDGKGPHSHTLPVS